jgi:hypothetical protein
MFGNSNGDNGGISRAGGSKARHNEEDCRKNFKRSNYVSKANVPKKATDGTFCEWCGAKYFEKRNFKVLSVQKKHPYRGLGGHGRRTRRSRNRSKNNINSNRVDENTLFRKAMENKDCKYNKQTSNNSFNLISPLLIDDDRNSGSWFKF